MSRAWSVVGFDQEQARRSPCAGAPPRSCTVEVHVREPAAVDVVSLDVVLQPHQLPEQSRRGVRRRLRARSTAPAWWDDASREYRTGANITQVPRDVGPICLLDLPLRTRVTEGVSVAQLPSGTVTFLFTDIEGSTRLWEAHPDAMRPALARHDEILRAAIETHGGHVVKTTGDGVHAAFATAARRGRRGASSAQCALGAEAWPLPDAVAGADGDPLRARRSCATATTTARPSTVRRGSCRSRTAARWWSRLSTEELARGGGIEVIDLGEHRLKDLGAAGADLPDRSPGPRTEFPPLRSLDAFTTNLPAQRTSFVGRDAELAAVKGALAEARLVTLTGVGGVGRRGWRCRSRPSSLSEYPDGVWLVELAAVGDPAAVPDAVAAAVGLVPQPGLTTTRDASSRRSQAAARCSSSTTASTCSTPQQTLSRPCWNARDLRRCWRPVEKDCASRKSGCGRCRRSGSRGGADEAIELFADRARAVAPDFAPRHARHGGGRRRDLPAIRRDPAGDRAGCGAHDRDEHDGIARPTRRPVPFVGRVAAWPRAPSDACGTRCNGRTTCSTTTSGRCSNGARCSPVASSSKPRLRSPVGGALDDYAVLDVLEALVRKSLVTADRGSGRTRYGMLETIRQFAEDELARTGTLTEARTCHTRYFAERARGVELVGGSRTCDRGRSLVRRRVGEPPGRLPLRRRRAGPGHRGHDRRLRHHLGLLPRTIRTLHVGRGADRGRARDPASDARGLERRCGHVLDGRACGRRRRLRGARLCAASGSPCRAAPVRLEHHARGCRLQRQRASRPLGRVLSRRDGSMLQSADLRGGGARDRTGVDATIRRGNGLRGRCRPRGRGERDPVLAHGSAPRFLPGILRARSLGRLGGDPAGGGISASGAACSRASPRRSLGPRPRTARSAAPSKRATTRSAPTRRPETERELARCCGSWPRSCTESATTTRLRSSPGAVSDRRSPRIPKSRPPSTTSTPRSATKRSRRSPDVAAPWTTRRHSGTRSIRSMRYARESRSTV